MNLMHRRWYEKPWVEGEKFMQSSLQRAEVMRIRLEDVVVS